MYIEPGIRKRLKEAIEEFISYKRRICYVCHEKVPKKTGRYSVGAFIIVHEWCQHRMVRVI